MVENGIEGQLRQHVNGYGMSGRHGAPAISFSKEFAIGALPGVSDDNDDPGHVRVIRPFRVRRPVEIHSYFAGFELK